MGSNRKIISDVINFLRANNIDERLPYRYILSELRDAAQTLIKQDTDNRRIFKQTHLWKSLPCGVELEESSFIQCNIDIDDPRRMMKSVEKIPDTYVTNYGSLIRVSSLDGAINFTETTFEDYKVITERRFQSKNSYFIISDGYLYLPNTYVEAIRLSGFFKNDDYLKFGKCSKSTSCIKPLDQEFNCPDYLVKIVKETVQKSLFQALQRPKDESPNMNSNEK
jgi:hypothetical protein